jgi:hypothetical protein
MQSNNWEGGVEGVVSCSFGWAGWIRRDWKKKKKEKAGRSAGGRTTGRRRMGSKIDALQMGEMGSAIGSPIWRESPNTRLQIDTVFPPNEGSLQRH